jgi:DNA polymerase V
MIREIDIPKDKEQEPLANPGKVSGFVSPAEDYAQRRLHISQKIVGDPVNTHYFEAETNEMQSFGITKGTILIVDRSKVVRPGCIIVCSINDEWYTRKLIKKDGQTLLSSGNDEKPINVTNQNVLVFGCVTWSCRPQT